MEGWRERWRERGTKQRIKTKARYAIERGKKEKSEKKKN